MNSVRRMMPMVLGLMIAVPTLAAAAGARTDVCLVNREFPGSTPLNTLVLRDVAVPRLGGATQLQGLFFTQARHVSPVHGSAVMAMDGSVRLGMFVHSSADASNDFTFSAVTDTTFAGTFKFDSDGDFVPNGSIGMEVVDCGTISIP